MAEKSTHYPKLTRSSTVSSSSSSSNYCSEDATKHEDLLVCLLCCSGFIQPRVLDCQHIFCEACLLDYAEGCASTTVNCPTCYRATATEEGISGLKSCEDNPIIQRKVSVLSDGGIQRCDICIYKRSVEEALFYCPKCALNLCLACKDVHEQQPVFRKHQCVSVANKDNVVLTCDAHYRMVASWLCVTCQGPPVCSVCILLKHQDHQVEKLQNALTLKRDKIRSLLRKLGPLLDRAELALESQHLKIRSAQKQGSLEKRNSVVEALTMADNQNTSLLKVSQYNKCFNMVLKMLDPSQSKRLILLYDDTVARLQTILNHELVNVPEKPRDEKRLSVRQNAKTVTVSAPQPQLLFNPELIWKMEKQTKDVGDLWNPCAVAFLPDGCTVIAEYDLINDKNNRLRVFSADGKQVSIIGQGKIRPLGVTVNKEGRIFVTDCENKRVKIFSICGGLVGEMGKGQFGWPYGVAVNSKGQVIVSDAFNDTISIFGGDGKRIKLIGSPGNANDQLRSPFHVTVDTSDNIYVADSGNNRVKMFNPEGCYIKGSSVGIKSQALTESKQKRLKSPRGVAIDMMGNVLVTDDHSRVSLLNKDLVYQQSLLAYKDGVKFPEALATNEDGKLAVTEWNPNQMFAMKVYTMYG